MTVNKIMAPKVRCIQREKAAKFGRAMSRDAFGRFYVSDRDLQEIRRALVRKPAIKR